MRQIDKKSLQLSHLESLIDNDIVEVKHLLFLAESFLKKEYKSTLRRAEREIPHDLAEQEELFVGECYAEDLQKIREVFPRILRYSLFVTAMSMVEGSIVTLCKGAKQIFKLEEEFDRKKPNVINRGIKYLEKHLGINTEPYKDYIEFVDSLKKVRNCIVHSEGRIGESSAESDIRHFVSGIPTINIDGYERIIILDGFVDKSMDTANLLLQRLFESVKNR